MIEGPREPLVITETSFGRPVEVYETDEYHRTPLQAMLEAKKYATGLFALHPRSVWVEGQEDPWLDPGEEVEDTPPYPLHPPSPG